MAPHRHFYPLGGAAPSGLDQTGAEWRGGFGASPPALPARRVACQPEAGYETLQMVFRFRPGTRRIRHRNKGGSAAPVTLG
jgi:hypothetical protein